MVFHTTAVQTRAPSCDNELGTYRTLHITDLVDKLSCLNYNNLDSATNITRLHGPPVTQIPRELGRQSY